ncbi:hypothetical protein J6590_099659 [Homalodisca vitripennis]|nr:hypothetical protein J6590_099659 [Homalodisca vitripennis]
MARTARWLERHFHNIKWEEGGIEYDEGIIRALCKPFVTVYAKGLEKVEFLSNFHNNVVDRNIVDSKVTIVSDTHCILPQHNSGFTYACALKKALELGGAGLNSVSPGAFNCSYGRPKLRKTGSSCVCMYVCDRYLYGRPKLRKSRGTKKNMLGGSKFVMEWLPPVMSDGWGSSPERTRLRPDLMGGVERRSPCTSTCDRMRGRVCILHFPIMSDFERLAIVCFLMATTMFVVMLGVLCCAPRARIGNTTVLLLILALLSVVSAGSEDEQPSTASTNGWTGDDDGAIDLTRPSTSRGGWSASGWSRRGQEDSARPRSEPVPIPTTTARPICVIEDVFSLAPHRFRPIRRVEDYMEFCDEDLGQMFAESDLVEALDRAESQEHDREITELLDRLNEPQEVWDETSLDQRISSLQPALLSQSQSAAVQRTGVWGWSLPAGSDDNSYDTSQRRRSVDTSVAPSPTPPTRPPSPVPLRDDLSPTGGSSTESASTFLSSPEYAPSIPPSPELPQIRPTPRVVEVANPSVAPSTTPPTRPPSPVPPHDGLSGLSPAGGSSTESGSTLLSSSEYAPSIPPSPELPQIRPTPRVGDWEARECIAALHSIRVLMRELQWTASRILLDTDHR